MLLLLLLLIRGHTFAQMITKTNKTIEIEKKNKQNKE